jgi:hypothetical protein
MCGAIFIASGWRVIRPVLTSKPVPRGASSTYGSLPLRDASGACIASNPSWGFPQRAREHGCASGQLPCWRPSTQNSALFVEFLLPLYPDLDTISMRDEIR